MIPLREECVLLRKYGYLTIFHLQDHAMIMGIESGEASFLLSIIGISNICGRIGFGAISDHPLINRIYLYNTCLIICGMSEYQSDKFSLSDSIIISYRPCDEQLLL